jgi:vesicle coat complex subunit
MDGLTDELLLSNEISYVNGVWEKVSYHRDSRKDSVSHLRSSFDDLRIFQQKGSGGYLDSMRKNLVEIAFLLEPEVEKLIIEWVSTEKSKYSQEH